MIKETDCFSHNSADIPDAELDFNGHNPDFNNNNQLPNDEVNLKA